VHFQVLELHREVVSLPLVFETPNGLLFQFFPICLPFIKQEMRFSVLSGDYNGTLVYGFWVKKGEIGNACWTGRRGGLAAGRRPDYNAERKG
jgi:hypothetical protein